MDARDPARLTRRDVLTGAVAVGAGFAVARRGEAAPAPMPTRAFGATGRTVSAFGLGCFYLGASASDAEAVTVLRRALELGCTYVDTAPSYGRGQSERRVGLALEGRRDGVFLATKTLERDPKAARRELEESLRRLRTDHVDLIQVHCVRDAADLDVVLSDAGPLPALLRARDEGLVRHVGVTGHEDPEVMKKCVEGFAWASVLLPLNPVDLAWKSFVEGTLPAAAAKGIARVGMKVFASGRLLVGDGAPSAADCLRFAYGLDVSTTIVGCASVAEVELAAKVATEAKPLDAAERAALVAACKPYSGKTGRGVEWYKRA
ncbi:MAG: aldo/keto reductase [Planctomycetota bacterium]